MRALVVFFGMMLIGANTFAQYGNDYNTYDSYDGPDRYFYDDNFDWRWDIRVRISDGIANGSLTRREADRLYNRLERIERKEFAYQTDRYLSAFEQDDIWEDVVYLNRLIGIELSDWDRTYYGYSMPGVAFRGSLPWYFGNSYDFYRFDRRGFGSFSLGYRSRNYFPKNHIYYGNRNFGYNWDRNKNYGTHNGWSNSSGRRDNLDRNRTYGSRGNENNSWGNRDFDRNNSGTWNNQDRNKNSSGNWGRSDSDRAKSGNNSSPNGNWGSSRGKENTNVGTSRDRNAESGGGNKTWGNNGNSSSPSTSPNRSQRNEAPKESSRSFDNSRSRRDEIMTPRSSTNKPETKTSRGEGSRVGTPDRERANDRSRGRNNES